MPTRINPSLAACLVSGFLTASTLAASPGRTQSWLTTENLQHRLSPQPELHWNESLLAGPRPEVALHPEKEFQTIFGMGASLEPTTCSNLFRLAPNERQRAIELLVHPESGIGMNLMRLCIGTPDFTGDPWYSYCDLLPGEVDPELSRFSIARDRAYILPVIRQALRTNPGLRFYASPWSPPGWMKSNGTLIGGHLLPRWYAAYANYFVRFIQAYEAEGIPIHAITIQNEPGVDRSTEKNPKWHYPSCHWTAEQERDFIRDHLGPALRKAGLKTRLWCYDHNYNETPKSDDAGISHPRTILTDPQAAAFVDGVGFHGYAGEPSGMSTFHAEFPKVPLYFTEGSVFTVWGAHDLIERFRNWASSYNAWVCILDDKGRPNNGPFPATHAILKLHSDTLRIEELFEYFCYGHFMKFVAPGAVRIDSTVGTKHLNNVAFRNPDGSIVLIVVNTTDKPTAILIAMGAYHAPTELPPKAVLTVTLAK